MRVGVDVRWMLGQVRGMGRYATQLMASLSSQWIGLAPAHLQSNNVINDTIFKGNGFFPWWEQCVLPYLAKENKFDFLVCPYNTGPIFKPSNVKLILIVHDLIFFRSVKELPFSVSAYQTLGRFYRRFVVPRVIGNADILLTVSEFTKEELVHRFKLDPNSVLVIPNAIPDDWLDSTPLPLEVRKPYLFTVAGEAPSKNVERLIEAFAIYKKSHDVNFTLKIAGIKNEHHSKFSLIARKFGIESQVELLGFISNDELRNYYREAHTFIFASLFEGFGIPLIEAMAAGTPVCCSNTTSLPEVVGDAALLFNPTDVHLMASAIRSMLTMNDTLRVEKIALGRSQVTLFTESAVNKKMHDFWSSLDAA